MKFGWHGFGRLLKLTLARRCSGEVLVFGGKNLCREPDSVLLLKARSVARNAHAARFRSRRRPPVACDCPLAVRRCKLGLGLHPRQRRDRSLFCAIFPTRRLMMSRSDSSAAFSFPCPERPSIQRAVCARKTCVSSRYSAAPR